MYAHYFASNKTKFVVISDGPTPNGKRIAVSDKVGLFISSLNVKVLNVEYKRVNPPLSSVSR